MIWNRNELWVGFILGLIIPVAAFSLLSMLFEQIALFGWVNNEGFSPTFRQRTLTLVALCFNLIPFNHFQKRRLLLSMRGIAVITVIYAVAWVVYFGKEIL